MLLELKPLHAVSLQQLQAGAATAAPAELQLHQLSCSCSCNSCNSAEDEHTRDTCG
jgi:hypothetical protein